jgi:plastocyanin
MKKIFTLIFILSLSYTLHAQTTHNVSVSSNIFTPADLTIQVGDIVVWTNTGGGHNVNGTTTTFPSNPEGFGSGAASSTLWTYSFTFDTEGEYDYQCDPHATLGMVGSITVNEVVLKVNELETDNFSIYPNPNQGRFIIQNGENEGEYTIEVIEITGKVVHTQQVYMTSNSTNVLNPKDLKSGMYLIKLINKKSNSIRTVRMIIN